nr:reverse transcriptase domain-containing protein [Tanacetum cinerariifolium]
MRTRSQSRENFPQQKASPAIVEPLRYPEAIVVPLILAEQFELKHSLINMMTSEQFLGLENAIHTITFVGAVRRWLEKEPPRSITTWEDLVSKFINEFFSPSRTTSLRNEISNFEQKFGESFHEAWDRYKDLLHACPHHGFTELHQLNTFYNALNHTDQHSLNAAADGNLLERSTQEVLTIIENKSKVRNSRSKSIASQVKACDTNSSSEIAKLTHAVNEQTSAMTTAITAMLRQFQATLPPALVKAVEESCVTCGGAYPYYQCLAAGGNTFLELRDNIQGYVSASAVQYNQGNPGYRPPGMANQTRPPGFAQPNLQKNQNRFVPPQGFNRGNNFNPEHSYQGPAQQHQNVHLNELEKVRRLNEANMKSMQTQIDMGRDLSLAIPLLTLRVNSNPSPLAVDLLLMDLPFPPSRMLKQKQQEKYEVQIQNFWQMFKKLHVNVTLTDALILMPKYQKMLKALLSNKEKLQEFANTPLNQNCSPVILKKLPKKLGDPGKFLIPCGFSELKCKALADLGASINLMPLSVWKKLGLPELISTRMTLELANRAICTPTGIARDVFVLVGKFTFPPDFVIVDYESDPRVPLILGRPFLRTARALIDVHGEEMILRNGDERLTLNMKHNTASYSNHPQRESANLINSFNVSSEHFLQISVSNQQSGNLALSLHQEFTSPEVTHEIHDSEGCNLLAEIFPDIDAFNDVHPHFDDDPLSGSTTYSANSLLEEFVDELALITYPPDYDDNLQIDIKSNLKEIEFLLYQSKDYSLKDSSIQTDLVNLDDYFDPIPEMFTEEHAPDYSSPPKFDVYLDEFLENESYADNFYDDPFNSEGEKIKESKLLIDELDLPCDFFFPTEYDSIFSEDFFRVDALPSTNNEDKEFNPCILIQENLFEIITRVIQDKKLATSNASLMLEDFDPPLYELPFFKEVPRSNMLLLFSSENEEKVFKLGIHTSEKVHSSFIPKPSHQGYNQIFKSPMKIFLFSCGKNTHILAVPCLYFYPLDQFKYGVLGQAK